MDWEPYASLYYIFNRQIPANCVIPHLTIFVFFSKLAQDILTGEQMLI